MLEYGQEYFVEQDQHRYYIFVLSLLLHGFLMLCFMLIEHNESQVNEPSIQMEEQNQLQNQNQNSQDQQTPNLLNQAELRAQSSDFGVPVTFTEELTEPEQESEHTEEQSNHQEEPTSDIEPVDIKEESEHQQGMPELSSIEAAINEIQTASKQSQEKEKPRKKRVRKRSSQNHKMKQIAMEPIKKELTFADLAAGFLQTVHRNRALGNAPISRAGNPHINPNEIDLKYASYMSKFQWYIENSSRLHPLKPKPPITEETFMQLLITLDKEGNLKGLQLVQSSGRMDLDEHIQSIIRKAAPYPPLPDHFESSNFSIPFAIKVGKMDPRIKNAEYIFASY